MSDDNYVIEELSRIWEAMGSMSTSLDAWDNMGRVLAMMKLYASEKLQSRIDATLTHRDYVMPFVIIKKGFASK